MATWEEQSSAYLAGHQLGSPLTYEHWLSNYVKTNVGVHKHPVKIRSTYPPPGAGSGTLYDQAVLYMDFTQNVARISGVWSDAASKVTGIRTSVAQMDDTAGNWTQVAASTPRISNKGVLLEAARTNSIRNNTMVGAVAGTPGTLPTNWGMANSGGLAQTVVGVGTAQGIDYIDVRIFGTAVTGSYTLTIEQAAIVAATNGQSWSASVFASIVGGSLANVTLLQFGMPLYSSVPAFLGDAGNMSLIGITSTLTRYRFTATISNASAASVGSYLLLQATSGVVDVTIRVGWPQLELGAFVTSPIKTSTVAVARTVESVNTTSFAFYTQGPGTLFTEFNMEIANTTEINTVCLLQTTNTDWIRFWRWSGLLSTFRGTCVIGGANHADCQVTSFSLPGQHKFAMAYAVNDFIGALNGVLSSADALGTLPVPVVLNLGHANTSGPINGYLRRVAYWNSRLPNAFLQTLTAP